MSLHKKKNQTPLHMILIMLLRILELCEKIQQTLNDVAMTPTAFSNESQVRERITTFYPVPACNHCTPGRASALQSSAGSDKPHKFPLQTIELYLVYCRAQLLNYSEQVENSLPSFSIPRQLQNNLYWQTLRNSSVSAVALTKLNGEKKRKR